jgi:hypothetical protein
MLVAVQRVCVVPKSVFSGFGLAHLHIGKMSSMKVMVV